MEGKKETLRKLDEQVKVRRLRVAMMRARDILVIVQDSESDEWKTDLDTLSGEVGSIAQSIVDKVEGRQ